MANPGWYLSDPGDLVVFPVAPIWPSPDELTGAAQKREYDIVNETIRGVLYANKMFNRKSPSYIFRVGYDDLIDYFLDLHDTVAGVQRPFYYVFDTGDMATVLYCRKEPDFLPKKLGAGMWNGVFQGVYDYELILQEEVAAAEILA
jgi:hypothetical protein